MTKIKELFDSSKDIFRSIEKVVTFGSLKPDHLKSEISEYVVTEKLKQNFEKILDSMSTGMHSQSHEVGIWVSGFYGSGKSSFAKYFGLGLKKKYFVDGTTFQDRLINRINNSPISQQLKTLVEKFDPEVFLIDLATQTTSGYTMAPVGTIIYNEIMKWAGYAPEEKLALLERKLEIDGRLDEFKSTVKKEISEDWDTLKIEDRLTAKGIAQVLAPRFYPNIWKDERSFNITRIDDIESDRDKIIQMLALIKKKTGKENVLFVIDEVGQYVASDDSLILKLQGTMENLKDIGNGKVWLIATAQQTLTEDNPNARFNSDKLYKLNARFPIPIDIEASDIKEITTKRLLGKSSDGAAQLKELFSKHGELLRLNTRLTNVERTVYKADLDEKSFIDLYPFLPHHFNLLLALLGRLAKKTGGIGLRSAIRVIQDVLTDKSGDLLAEGALGRLATTTHIYNVLKSDIKKSYPHVSAAVEKVITIFSDASLEAEIAKTIATLQILDDFHLSVENLAVMLHPDVEKSTQLEIIKSKVNDLKNTKGLTLKEIDGQLRFMTDAIIKLEDDKHRINVSSNQARTVIQNQIQDIFITPPTARIANTKTVKSGIQFFYENRLSKLSDVSEEIQAEIEFALRDKYDATLEEVKQKSMDSQNEAKIFVLGILEEGQDRILEEIVRCEEVASWKNRHGDKEVLDYLNSQIQEANRLKDDLRRKLMAALMAGEMVFRGGAKPAKSVAEDLREATNIFLKAAAEKVFSKYDLAPISLEAAAAQKLLQFEDLRQVPATLNPFSIIRADASIDVNHPAIKAIQDYLQSEGQVDGRKLMDHFLYAPFGWHRDTTRYLVTIMFISSIIKLRISADWVKVKGPVAIEKLSTTAALNPIGVALHTDNRPTHEQLLLASKHLAELTRTTVLPLDQKISEAVLKFFPEFQRQYAELKVRLEKLKLPGVEKAEAIQEGIAEILKGDASDATFSLGKTDSSLFLDLLWAKRIKAAIENGIEKVIEKIHSIRKEVGNLPNDGVNGELKQALNTHFAQIDNILSSDAFFEQAASLNDSLTEIENEISSACERFKDDENNGIKKAVDEIVTSTDWAKLNDEQKHEIQVRLNNSFIKDKAGLKGIREIVNEVYSFNNSMKGIKKEIEEIVSKHNPPPHPTKKTKLLTLSKYPKRVETKEDLIAIIDEFSKIKDDWSDDEVVDINW